MDVQLRRGKGKEWNRRKGGVEGRTERQRRSGRNGRGREGEMKG